MQSEDLEALRSLIESAPGSSGQACGHTVRTDLKDGKVVALESFRPFPDGTGDTRANLVSYATSELDPFVGLANEGKIRALVIAAELTDDRVCLTYPVGQWEAGLIAATELMRHKLVEQG